MWHIKHMGAHLSMPKARSTTSSMLVHWLNTMTFCCILAAWECPPWRPGRPRAKDMLKAVALRCPSGRFRGPPLRLQGSDGGYSAAMR